MVADSLWVDPDDDLFHDVAPFLEPIGGGEVGSATSSWAVPSCATPRHGVRRSAAQMRAKQQEVGSRKSQRSAEHLDGVWPDTDPGRSL